MKVKVVKMFENVKLPTYATDGSGCFDIYGHSVIDHRHDFVTWGTGLRVEVPNGYVMVIYSRSGHGFNKALRLANCVGVIDSDYRGEIMVKLVCDNGNYPVTGPSHGNAVAQGMIIPYEQVVFDEVYDLSSTERGEGGFGSTD